jgi:hypothetical protein
MRYQQKTRNAKQVEVMKMLDHPGIVRLYETSLPRPLIYICVYTYMIEI